MVVKQLIRIKEYVHSVKMGTILIGIFHYNLKFQPQVLIYCIMTTLIHFVLNVWLDVLLVHHNTHVINALPDISGINQQLQKYILHLQLKINLPLTIIIIIKIKMHQVNVLHVQNIVNHAHHLIHVILVILTSKLIQHLLLEIVFV